MIYIIIASLSLIFGIVFLIRRREGYTEDTHENISANVLRYYQNINAESDKKRSGFVCMERCSNVYEECKMRYKSEEWLNTKSEEWLNTKSEECIHKLNKCSKMCNKV